MNQQSKNKDVDENGSLKMTEAQKNRLFKEHLKMIAAGAIKPETSPVPSPK